MLDTPVDIPDAHTPENAYISRAYNNRDDEFGWKLPQ
jgi:hypothetical protein